MAPILFWDAAFNWLDTLLAPLMPAYHRSDHALRSSRRYASGR
jgi:hypothetical protein